MSLKNMKHTYAPTLDVGFYRLTKTIVNPLPSAARRGWEYAKEWREGTIFCVHDEYSGTMRSIHQFDRGHYDRIMLTPSDLVSWKRVEAFAVYLAKLPVGIGGWLHQRGELSWLPEIVALLIDKDVLTLDQVKEAREMLDLVTDEHGNVKPDQKAWYDDFRARHQV